jgi:inhibitor of cysteine peptidase
MRSLPVFILIVISAMISCKKDDVKPEGPKYDYIVAVDSSFTIELVSNPTTGYTWQWANRKTESIVDTTGYSFLPDNPGTTGSTGKEKFVFKGKRSGIDSLKFLYKRSWDSDSPAKDSKVFTVKVK